MRLLLTLQSSATRPVIPINYQYPVSAAVYKILEKADAGYATFLHEQGYGKGFKLFTFSDLRCRFEIRGDRLQLLQPVVQLLICFQLPQAAETFIRGLFLSQQIVIADKKSKGVFEIRQVESQPDITGKFAEHEFLEVLLDVLSPVISGIKNENGNYDFLTPEEAKFSEMLQHNWQEKALNLYEKTVADTLMEGSKIEVRLNSNPPKSRLITIKAGTTAETKIRGFKNFRIAVSGKKAAIELLLNAGIGLYNAQGFGCVGVVKGGEGRRELIYKTKKSKK